MSTEAVRAAAAAALRDLNHAFAKQDADDEQLLEIERQAQAMAAALDAAPRRDRLALMRSSVASGTLPMGSAGSGFNDRAVAGTANPTSADIEAELGAVDADVVARVVLRRAFEGAPGRAHGGIVAAVFDDVTGFVIGKLREPAFTGELTVRYVKPVPIETPLEMRARLVDRERRKLFITAECRDGDEVVATCKAIYITVDPSRFAGFPDPR
jgi:acyl-coenzyme A thioesterase PaaI-like protein